MSKSAKPPAQAEWKRNLTWLRDNIGEYNVWVLSGSTGNESVVQDWVSGRKKPSPGEKLKMALAYKVLNRIADTKGRAVARAWFIGKVKSNQSPCEALGQGLIGKFEELADEISHKHPLPAPE